MKDIQIVVSEEGKAWELRTITAANVGWLLGAGWMFYFASLLLNLFYYLMHPSSPELGTWGAEEKLEEWTPPEEKEKRKQSKTIGPKNQPDASLIELTELLPQDLERDESVLVKFFCCSWLCSVSQIIKLY